MRPAAILLIAIAIYCSAKPAIAGESAIAAVPASCMEHIADKETEHDIPAGLLTAIGLAESGRTVSSSGRVAWPWTVNAAGEGSYFETKSAAVAFVEAKLAEGIESIDVGCMQVNLKHHPNAFSSLESAFDPSTNVAYAAKFLSALYAEEQSWLEAAQRYHSSTSELGEAYGQRVAAIWQGLEPGIAPRQLATANTAKQTVSNDQSGGHASGLTAKTTVGASSGPASWRLFGLASTVRPLDVSATSNRPSFVAPRLVPGLTGKQLSDYWLN